MNFFKKDADGNLVPATREDIEAKEVPIYWEDGNLFQKAKAPEIKTGTDGGEDPVAQLNGVVKEMLGGAVAMKEAEQKWETMFAEMKAQQEALQKASAGGFPISLSGGGSESDMDSLLFKDFALAKQCRKLMEKPIIHSQYKMTEEKREMLAKYFLLFLKAGFMQDPLAIMEFRKRYGELDMERKTVIGDAGNTFPVPDIVMEEILYFAREVSVVLQEASVVEMTSEKQSYPLETSSVTVGWGNTTSESEPGISEVELTAVELSAYSAIRNMTLADARSDIVSWLAGNMAEAVGLELDNSAFNGDGTETYGGTSGMLTAACGYSVVMGSGSTAFSQMDATTLSEMIAKLDGLRKQGAKYYMHGSNIHYVRSLKDDNGRPIFFENVGSPAPPTIWGYPYREVIKMPSTTAANTAFATFGNLKNFLAGRRLGATALQVDPYGLWTTNRTRFKIYQRWGNKIGLANGLVRLLTAEN
jgi:HK97 family phage major capsid protein